MNQGKTATYRRVIISSELTLQSDLHIGTGGLERVEINENEKGLSNSVAIDQAGKPYIPASTLRGYLASHLSRDDKEGFGLRWFGLSRQSEDDSGEQHGQKGALRVYDGRWLSGDNTSHVSRTSIDNVTGTALAHSLSTHKMVLAGTAFRLHIEMDTWGQSGADADSGMVLIDDSEIEQLLALLQRLDNAQLGTGKSVGQGLLDWSAKNTDVKVLSDSDFGSWVVNNFRAGKKGKANKYQSLSKGFKPWNNSSNDLAILKGAIDTERLMVEFELVSDDGSPILIDPESVKNETGNTVSVFKQNHGEVMIAGSTLKGWFRAHSRRILLTLCHDELGEINSEIEQRVEESLGKLFGSTELGKSAITFFNATAEIAEEDYHEQTFNAVDRFTGGVKDKALYSVKALRMNKAFNGRIALNPQRMTPSMELLMMYVWRDAQEGDLVLGWGKAKGYGRLSLRPTNPDNLPWQNVDTSAWLAAEKDLFNELGITAEVQV